MYVFTLLVLDGLLNKGEVLQDDKLLKLNIFGVSWDFE